ncbi:peptidylprolyl isomerase PrsA [Streptococcus thoraltensis]|uniref:peptidylprolyl isomerase PrsA n=1 Tax=Streptococcus thoraltensis TaxID=55085 RepID=UPI00036110D4|nr:peptidylprolyl isomerase PrsA [Streptococcus thoraltensis]MDY4761149.1 peptidylprolyl isomerase PrsA [Streptococcus thoraltensis]
MKKQTKLLSGVVTFMSVLALAACSQEASPKDNLVTMKGDTITVSDFYNQAKDTTAGRQAMLTLVLDRVFQEQYGDKISDKEVTKAYNEQVDAYGSNFSAALTSAGMTEKTYKQQIRVKKMIEYAVEKAAKKELTDSNYQKAYQAYTPETTAEVIKLDTEEKAKEVLEKAKAEGADFAKVAKDNTKSDKVDYKFDSSDTTLPKEVKDAAFKLKEGEVSELVKVVDTTNYKPNYYIVKTIKKESKNPDWKTYKKRLTETILNEKKSDATFQNQVIGKTLEKANVKIKDKSFSNILSQYTATDSNTSSSSSK